MKFFRNASIQRKQTLIILATTAAALLLACGALTAYEVITFRREMVQELSTLADIVDHNTFAALDFNDPKNAAETLAAFVAKPDIMGACIFTTNGEIFATYDRPGDNLIFQPPKSQAPGHVFTSQQLSLYEPIVENGTTIGMLYLESDLQALYSRLKKFAAIVAGVFLLTILAAFFLSAKLQRFVSEPILHLARTARTVAKDRNYSLRAVKRSGDELGDLTDGFNEMLVQIQERDAALQKNQDELEHRVEARTGELANSLSLLNATLESTADGILVVDGRGHISHFNEKFMSMWRIPRETNRSPDDQEMLGQIMPQLKYPEQFLARVEELYANPGHDSFELLELKDGKFFERYSKPQWVGPECVGRVWNFRDITQLKKTNEQLLTTSRMAGMAEVATSVLHNVGNVLNSVNISSSTVSDKIRNSKVVNLAKAVALMHDHAADLPGFFAHDPKGRQLPAYLGKLATHLVQEQADIQEELASLSGNVEHIKEIVAMQQSYAKVSGLVETLNLVDLVEDALRMNAGAMDRHGVNVTREYSPVPPMPLERHKVLQILVNLIRNAKYAVDDNPIADKQVTLRVALDGNDLVRISIIDNGVGIPAENLTRIFSHGFTTKKEGHGFGLHSAALAAKEMGGSLSVHSDGPGKGATFIVELPLNGKNDVL